MDKSKLEELVLKGLSTRSIAEIVGSSQTNTRHWLAKYGLETKPALAQKNAEKPVFQCLNCKLSKPVGKNATGKYCSISCQQEYRWKTSIKPEIESGTYYSTSSKSLKRYLTEVRGYRCEICGLSKFWNGKELTLQVDHIDGNSDDCSPSNLRLLCPNCHSQTDTFNNKGGLGKKDTKRNRMIRKYRGSD